MTPDPDHPQIDRPSEAASPAGRSGCRSYLAGHQVHWIQALRTSNKPEAIAASWHGTLSAIEGDTLTIAHPEGAERRFRNHDVPRLRDLARTLPVGVTVNDQYAVLRIGSYVFSIASDDQPWTPCIPGDTREASS